MRSLFRAVFVAAFTAFAVLPLTACFSSAPEPAPVISEAEILERQLAAEVAAGSALLDDFRSNRAGAFLARLPKEARESFGEKGFASSRKEIEATMGNMASFEYLMPLDAPGFRTHLWKVVFERRETMDPDKTLRQETLFRVVVVKNPKAGANEAPYILTFGFL